MFPAYRCEDSLKRINLNRLTEFNGEKTSLSPSLSTVSLLDSYKNETLTLCSSKLKNIVTDLITLQPSENNLNVGYPVDSAGRPLIYERPDPATGPRT